MNSKGAGKEGVMQMEGVSGVSSVSVARGADSDRPYSAGRSARRLDAVTAQARAATASPGWSSVDEQYFADVPTPSF